MDAIGSWRGRGVWLVVLVAMLCLPTRAWAGKLSSARSEVRGGSSSSSSSSSSGGSRSSSSGSSRTSDIGWGASTTYASPVYGGGSCCVSSGASDGTVYIEPAPRRLMLRRPYDRGFDGYHVTAAEDPGTAKAWAFDAGVEGAYVFDGVWRGGVNLRAGTRFLEIDSRTSFFLEAPGGVPTDAMYLGDAGLWLVAARLRHWTMRLGGGARYMVDGRAPGEGPREYALGWNVGAGVDFFPVRPLVGSARVDVGRLWQATVVQARGTIGAMIGPLEVFAGWDHLQVGAVRLGGPLVGVRGWF
jgi:hypothetical protein